MGYRIEYGSTTKYERRTAFPFGRINAMTVLFLIAFLLLTGVFWPEGAAMLRRIFIPGDPEVTTAAISSMLDQLHEGEPVVEVIADFCGEIIAHGQAAH